MSRASAWASSQLRSRRRVCAAVEVDVLSSVSLLSELVSPRKPFPHPRGWTPAAAHKPLWKGSAVALGDKHTGLLCRGAPWQGHRGLTAGSGR